MSAILRSILRKTGKDFVRFLEKPATTDEREIAAIIGEFMRDVNAPFHDHVHDYFTADAQIRSVSLGETSRTPEEVHALRRRLHISFGDVFLDEALIRITADRAGAQVSGVLTYGNDAFKKNIGRVFHLVHSNRWLISAVDWYTL